MPPPSGEELGDDLTQELPSAQADAAPQHTLPTAEVELARVGKNKRALYSFEEDHKRREGEAKVKLREVEAEQARDDRDMRKDIAGKVFEAITIQVGIVDAAFLIYGFWNGWDVPGSTVTAWLGATVVQVIAVGLVITRSLFPANVRLAERLSALLPGDDVK